MKLKLLPFLLLLSACNGWYGPKPFTMNTDIQGPPEYKQGWKDGCESGFATYGPVHYKLWYTYYQNYEMLKSVEYTHGWHEAFDYCRMYNLKFHTDPL